MSLLNLVKKSRGSRIEETSIIWELICGLKWLLIPNMIG
jgi:hypothetical protein